MIGDVSDVVANRPLKGQSLSSDNLARRYADPRWILPLLKTANDTAQSTPFLGFGHV